MCPFSWHPRIIHILLMLGIRGTVGVTKKFPFLTVPFVGAMVLNGQYVPFRLYVPFRSVPFP